MFWQKKGTVEIKVDSADLTQGDTVKGALHVSILKPVTVEEISIRFIGRRRETIDRNGKKSSRNLKFHDEKTILRSKADMSVSERSYPFILQIPEQKDYLPENASNGIKKAFDIMRVMKGGYSSVRWYLEARLKIPGMFNDVKQKIELQVA